MLETDPTVNLPYWQWLNSFAAPEKDIIFEWFEHAVNENNDYCVTDGAFANQKVNYPEPHCIRPQWNPNGTICVFEPPEYYNSIISYSKLISAMDRNIFKICKRFKIVYLFDKISANEKAIISTLFFFC
jgi:hypothetical protein